MAEDILAGAGFVCDRAAVVGDVIKRQSQHRHLGSCVEEGSSALISISVIASHAY